MTSRRAKDDSAGESSGASIFVHMGKRDRDDGGTVRVEGDIERAIRRLRRMMRDSGLLRSLADRSRSPKRSDRKKLKAIRSRERGRR